MAISNTIDEVEDASFIEKLKILLKSRSENYEVTEASYNDDIDAALNNIAQGNFVAEEEAKSISKKWSRK